MKKQITPNDSRLEMCIHMCFAACSSLSKKTLTNAHSTHLSEFAGRLVTGLKMQTLSKMRRIRYTRPTLNGVNISNSLHTK